MGDAPAAPQANCPPNILQRPLLGCWLLDNWSWRVGGGFGAVSLNVSYLKYPLSKDTQSPGSDPWCSVQVQTAGPYAFMVSFTVGFLR